MKNWKRKSVGSRARTLQREASKRSRTFLRIRISLQAVGAISTHPPAGRILSATCSAFYLHRILLHYKLLCLMFNLQKRKVGERRGVETRGDREERGMGWDGMKLYYI